ncbi:uncharacterized protein [Coffea arabica]|uniref:Leucine-rich repeat-containing N-terminal plant-type domain-containing protein n=1 Tax=Coffea arabica TaxID=13443 RepID=A0A6P6V848_COFAR
MFLFSSILVTSHFPFGRSKQAYTHSNVSCIESERQAFLQFRNGLIDESNHLSSWIGEDCCSWEVFDGEIPRHLGNLSCLRHLELGGVTPSLTWNRLTTKDLDWIVGLSSLEGLILSEVNFTSLSSHELGESNFNNYTIPPWLHNLTGLHNLGLSSNHLSDPIHGLSEQMTSLVYLDLGENRFDASTLMSLCNVSSLNYLDLSFNDMQGSIPSEIGQLSKLQVLDISSNSLTGVLSEDHFAKLGELKSLNLSENLFTLNVSSWWVPPFQLREIMMSSIKVGPLFPVWLRTQKEVQSLEMQNAGISDSIPNWPHESNWSWFYAGIEPRYAVGLLGVLGILQFNKSWRYAYFRFLENVYDKICVMIALKANQLRRNFH